MAAPVENWKEYAVKYGIDPARIRTGWAQLFPAIATLPEELRADVERALNYGLPLLGIGAALEAIPTKSGPLSFGLGLTLQQLLNPFIRHAITGPLDQAMRFWYRTDAPPARQIIRAIENGGYSEATGRTALQRSGLADEYTEPLLQAALRRREELNIRFGYEMRISALALEQAQWEAVVKPVEDDLSDIILSLKTLVTEDLKLDRDLLITPIAEEIKEINAQIAALRKAIAARKKKESEAA